MTLEEEFTQRRIDETKRVLELQREVEVQFAGIIDSIETSSIEIAGLNIALAESIRTVDLTVGMRVEVMARTRTDQTLLATAIRILDLPQPNLQPDVEPTLTKIEPSMTSTMTPTPIAVRDTVEPTTPTHQPTERPSPIPTHRNTDRAEVSPTDSSRSSDECEVTPPSDWVRYTIQAGDTPSELAVNTGISLDEFYRVNCDLNPRLIIVGDVIFVPYPPRRLATPTEVIPTRRIDSPATPIPDQQSSINSEDSRPTQTRDDVNDTSDRRKNDDGDDKPDDRR